MRLHKKAEAVSAIILAIIAIAVASVVITTISPPEADLITGAVGYEPVFCIKGPRTCIDLDGDGKITLADEDIFALFLNGTFDENDFPVQFNFSDFDGDGDVDQIDFQQCFVPIRDFTIDQEDGNVACNRPVLDPVTNRTNHTGCDLGCADLNGDGFVNIADHDILISDGVWNKNITDTNYTMADLNGDGEIDTRDKSCFTPYFGKIVMCNMPVHANHTSITACPDLINSTTETGNDGIVDADDRALFNQYKDSGNVLADFSGDGKVNALDEHIFNRYIGKVVDCNIFQAPWHIGGVDANNTNLTSTGFDSFGALRWQAQSFNTTREGQLTKIRFYMSNTSAGGPYNNITVSIRPDNGSGAPNMTSLIDQTTIPGFAEGSFHFVTAYFDTPPSLDNATLYHIVVSASDSGAFSYWWRRSLIDIIPGNQLLSTDGGDTWSPKPDNDFIFQTFITTACADLNGDGFVDFKDEAIIEDIPDGMTPLGFGSYNGTFDLNNDQKITDADADIIADLISQGPVKRPSLVKNNSNISGEDSFGWVNYLAQGFTLPATEISKIGLYLAANNDNRQTITVQIQGTTLNANNETVPNGLVEATTTITGFNNKTFQWYNATFASPVDNLSAGMNYTIVVSAPTAGSSSAEYNWSKGTFTVNASKSINGGGNWDALDHSFAYEIYDGDPTYNATFDVAPGGLINNFDKQAIEQLIPSFNSSLWTPLVDFNAIFNVYERLRDKTLGFDAYSGQILKCGLPSFPQSNNNRRCEPEIGENFTNSNDCDACNNDGFCSSTEDFLTCADCSFMLNIPQFNNFDGNTTNFFEVDNLSSVSNAVLEIRDFGKIEFLEDINVSKANLDAFVNISFNNVSIDISALPQLNVSARITLYNISELFPGILLNGVVCPEDVCTIISYNGSDLVFNVTGFSSYSSEDLGPIATEFTGNATTNFSFNTGIDIRNVTNLTLETAFGKITFSKSRNSCLVNQ